MFLSQKGFYFQKNNVRNIKKMIFGLIIYEKMVFLQLLNLLTMAISFDKVQKFLGRLRKGEMSHDEFVKQFTELIGTNGFVENDLHLILNANYISYLTASSLLAIAKKTISLYGDNAIQCFDNILNYIRLKDEKTVIDFTVSLITDSNGRNRSAGRHVWDNMSLQKSTFDINDLPSKQQALFVISMLQDLGNPETRIPKVLPLFNSNEVIVRQILYLELVKYCDHYLGVVKPLFDSCKIIESEESNNFRKYCAKYSTFLDTRIKCKELNPKYTQADLYEEASREVVKNMQSMTSGIQNDMQIDKFFKRVRLARGTVWRSHDGRLQNLAHIKFSIPFPIAVNALSALESTEYMLKINNDWDKITDLCEIL